MPQTRRRLQRWLDRVRTGGPAPVGFSFARRSGEGVRETITVNGAPQRGQRSAPQAAVADRHALRACASADRHWLRYFRTCAG